MNEEQILSNLRRIIIEAKAETAVILPEQVQMSTELLAPPLAMDSIDFVATIIGIERVFGVIAEDEDFLTGSMRTVGDVVGVVKRILGVSP